MIRSIDLSWHSSRLREPGRRLFRLLGCFPAGLARADREALFGDDALAAAEQVVEVGLAVSRAGRLDLLPPVRGYALAERKPTPEEENHWCRHFLTLTRQQGGRVGAVGGAEAAARLAPELPNLEAAFAVALIDHRRPAAVAAARGYAEMLRWTGLGRPVPLSALAVACHQAGEVQGEAN